jgi:hypothetical protein
LSICNAIVFSKQFLLHDTSERASPVEAKTAEKEI